MTTMNSSSVFDKLGFEPSLEEQLLLSKIHNHNLLVVYSAYESLIRVHSLLILFYLNQLQNEKNPPKILILSKRSFQQRIQSSLKAYVNRLTTILNGSILPNARKLDYNIFSLIFATPKIAKNDLKDGLFTPNHFELIIFNQAEMGASSSSLRYLVNKMQNSRFCGFTQVSNIERLKQVCKNLQFEEVIKLESAQYNQERSNIQYYSVPLPQEYFFVLELLDQIRTYELEVLKKLGFDVSLKSSIREIAAIHEGLAKEHNNKLQIRTGNLQRIITLQKIIISQGFPAVINYLDSLHSKLEDNREFLGKKAIAEFLKDIKIQKLREFINSQKHLEHPKSQILLKLISDYEFGILIVTHNYYNANFLKEYLTQHDLSVIHLKGPISSLPKLKLAKNTLSFTEGKSPICITNSVNEFILQKAKIVIAYDVNADIVERLNNLESNIPKVFLIAKQTNEEARFFYLKRLGTNSSQQKKFDSKVINVNLKDSKGNQSVIEETTQSSKELSHSSRIKGLSSLKPTLEFHKSLYEFGLPYVFSSKEYDISTKEDLSFPGVILNQKLCFIILLPETIPFLISTNISSFYKALVEDYSQVHLIVFVHSLRELSFNFRYEILHQANKYNIWIFLLDNDTDMSRLMNRLNKE
jgi:hypothetical protein